MGDLKQVAIVTAYNAHGQLLVGKRKDSDKYTLPGGHIEKDEEPGAAAARELFEETGLHPQSLSFLKHYINSTNVELWCFSAFVTGDPHSNYDPDQEVPEWEWIDVEEGLPPKVFNNLHGPQGSDNLVTQLFDLKKAEEELLMKFHPTPKFPKLGMGDDRRETQIVSTPQQRDTRLGLTAAAFNRDNPGGHKVDVKEAIKEDSGRRTVGVTSLYPSSKASYSLSSSMRADHDGLNNVVHSHNNADVATVQHENFHHMMNRVREKYGRGSATHLARNLYLSVPAPERKAVHDFTDTAAGKWGPGKVTSAYGYEERIAKMGNYLNNPGERDAYHAYMHHTPNERAWHHTIMKKAYKRIQQNAQNADHTWLRQRYDLTPEEETLMGFQKSEDDVTYLEKAEDEVFRMLAHPEPTERTMALKLHSVTPDHVLAASLDPSPEVHQAAIKHHHFQNTQAHQLLESTVGSDGKYPLVQQSHFLAQHPRVSASHLVSFMRTAREHSPDMADLATKLMARHPAATSDMLRVAYLDPSTAHDVRLDILGHANAPADILGHAIQLGCLAPPPVSGELACKASEHIHTPTNSLSHLAMLAADKGDPHVNAIAEHALAHGKVSQEVQRDLLMRAMTRPQSTAPRLLEALLRGPSAASVDPRDYDRMVQFAHQTGSATMIKSLSEHPAFGARHMLMLLDKPEAVEEVLEKFDSSFLSDPDVKAQFGATIDEHAAFKAAAFLADTTRKQLVNPEVLRAALYQANGDFEKAALMAYGIEYTEGNLKALEAVMKMGHFTKSEPTPQTAKSITAARPEGEDVANAVARAFEDRFAFEILLNGKHSKGSMICNDKQTGKTWLLKSGSGGAGGAAGASQDPSNPNAREAAFYHITREWGISDAFPRAELLIIDGHLFAALQWLGNGFKTLDKREKEEPGTARRVLHSYLHDGTLHKWAVADYILGQPDRHGQNVMVNKAGDVKLIDEGSAFAGTKFDPGRDQNSFVPYYLRAWHVDPSFNQLSVPDKMRYMPRVSASMEKELRAWIEGIDGAKLRELCARYEIDSGPTTERLDRVKSAIASNPVDVAINHLWVTT